VWARLSTWNGSILAGMVRMTVLASGSRGNSTVVCTERTRVLVDAGLSCRELLKRMRLSGEEPEALDGIVITHEHQDHVQGLAVLARKLGVPVYFTEATHRAWVRWMTPQKKTTYAEWMAARAAERERAERGITEAETEVEAEAKKCAKDPGELSRLPGVEYFRLATSMSFRSPFRMMRRIPADLFFSRRGCGSRLRQISVTCRRMRGRHCGAAMC